MPATNRIRFHLIISAPRSFDASMLGILGLAADSNAIRLVEQKRDAGGTDSIHSIGAPMRSVPLYRVRTPPCMSEFARHRCRQIEERDFHHLGHISRFHPAGQVGVLFLRSRLNLDTETKAVRQDHFPCFPRHHRPMREVLIANT